MGHFTDRKNGLLGIKLTRLFFRGGWRREEQNGRKADFTWQSTVLELIQAVQIDQGTRCTSWVSWPLGQSKVCSWWLERFLVKRHLPWGLCLPNNKPSVYLTKVCLFKTMPRALPFGDAILNLTAMWLKIKNIVHFFYNCFQHLWNKVINL